MSICSFQLRALAGLLLLSPLFGCGEGRDGTVETEEMSVVAQDASGGGETEPHLSAPRGEIAGRIHGMSVTGSLGAAPPPAPPPPPDQAPIPTQSSAAGGAMLIRTGEARIEVDSLQAGVAAVERAATALGGWVAESSIALGERQWHSARLVVKVPSNRWEELLGGLRAIGELRQMTTGTEDVGEQFVDLTAQLENAQRLEERYLQLLENRTGSLEDLLAVERELARVRERIEILQGRLRYLGERVATSTMVVHLEEETNLLATSPGANPLRDALGEAWRNFLRVVTGGIALFGAILPIVLLLALAAGLWRWRRARARSGEV